MPCHTKPTRSARYSVSSSSPSRPRSRPSTSTTTGRGTVEPAHQVQDRGLAGAARTDDREELRGRDVEIDAGERDDADVAHPVHLVRVAEAHERVGPLRPVAVGADDVLDHSASPRSTPVTDARRSARADSASAIAVAATMAASAMPSDTQSIRNTGGGYATERLGPT